MKMLTLTTRRIIMLVCAASSNVVLRPDARVDVGPGVLLRRFHRMGTALTPVSGAGRLSSRQVRASEWRRGCRPSSGWYDVSFSLAEVNRRFGGTYFLNLQFLCELLPDYTVSHNTDYVPPNCRWTSARLHGITSQNIIICIVVVST
jgi:hypothetical protein